MKKTLLTLFLVGFSVVAFSQASVGIGIKAGANFANASTGDLMVNGSNFNVDSESITSFHGGVYGLIKLANIGIQPEILFSKQGSNISVQGFSDEVDFTYVNVPVMVKFYLPAGLNLQAGPQFGILTDAVDADGENIEDSFKGSDLSAAFGAGWDAPFGLQFSARYVLGLSDINDDVDGTEFKNRTFQISVGYSLFKLGN